MGVGAVRTESGAESSPSRGGWGRPEREATSLAVSGAPHPGRLGPQSPEGTWREAVTGGHRPGPDLSPRLWLSFHLLQPQFPFLPTGMTPPGPEGPSVGPPVSPGRGPCVCFSPGPHFYSGCRGAVPWATQAVPGGLACCGQVGTRAAGGSGPPARICLLQEPWKKTRGHWQPPTPGPTAAPGGGSPPVLGPSG